MIDHARYVSLSLSVVFLVGCANISPQPMNGPSGRPAYTMKCSGMGRTLEDCYQKAGELCTRGYTVIDRDSSIVAVPVSGGVVAAPRHMLAVECK